MITHWYDLTCPFCYIAQVRNAALSAGGFALAELGFQAHPEVPPEGVSMGRRSGPMYEDIAREAAAAGLPLQWRDKLPNSRMALAAVEETRVREPEVADNFRRALFHAHFAADRDIGNPAVVAAVAQESGVADGLVEEGWRDGAAFARLEVAQAEGVRDGVTGTPAWRIGPRLLVGLQPASVLVAAARGFAGS